MVPSVRTLAALLIASALALGVPAAADAAQRVGVQTHLMWSNVGPTERDRQLDLAAAAAAHIIRVDVSWASLQPDARGHWSSWELRRLDATIAAARARGIRLLLMLWETPCWASRAPARLQRGCSGAWWQRGVQRYGPRKPADYAAALALLARRYGRRVTAWEIWNEPNSRDFFRSAAPADEYAALVRAGYDAAKAAAPEATILAGSLMQSDARFTQQLYDRGIRGHLDGFSIHPYSDDRSPLDLGLDEWIAVSFVRGVPAVRDVMLRNRDSSPMWLTEFGWSTTTTRGAQNWRNGVSPTTQATYVEQALRQARRWPYVRALIYYDLVDEGSDAASTIDNFGLAGRDHHAKPALRAFRAAARRAARAGGARRLPLRP